MEELTIGLGDIFCFFHDFGSATDDDSALAGIFPSAAHIED
jgi:hypothetical protein